MKAAELLAIDVGSELRTLCEAQLRGTWQVPAELVRLALRGGASEISAERRRRGFALRWVGAPVTPEVLRHLQAALDEAGNAEQRHRAIVALEAGKAQALLWAAGLPGAVLRVHSTTGRQKLRFEHRDGSRPKLSSAGAAGDSDRVELRWSCAGLDRGRAADWLRSATRFAPSPVEIDGRPAPQGFPGGLFHLGPVRISHQVPSRGRRGAVHRRLQQEAGEICGLGTPVPCRLGLTRSGEDPLLWLLRDGVVSARATVPGYPSFQAAVELGGVVPPDASAADMRRAVNPYLEGLIDRAVRMMVQVADRLPALAEADRQRLGTLLLQAAHRGLREEEVRRLPLISPAGTEGRLLSLHELSELVGRRGSTFLAVDPKDDPGEFLFDPETTFRVSNEERNLLSALLGVRFRSPARRRLGALRRSAVRLRSAVATAVRRSRGLVGSRPLPEDALSSEERRLLAAIRIAAPNERFHLCAGGGAVRRSRRGLIVPREHPAVAAGACAVAGDLTWLYPVLLTLWPDEAPPSEVREQWRRRILEC